MPSARLGLIVGKRRVGKAHQRNRIKRVVRECFRQRRHLLPSVDLVFQVMKPLDNAKLAQECALALDLLVQQTARQGPPADSQSKNSEAAG
jgi:ribonuclease P protein component